LKGYVNLNLPEYAKVSRYTLKYFDISANNDNKTTCYVKFYDDGDKKMKHFTGNKQTILKFVSTL
jgi:hypothetical protein